MIKKERSLVSKNSNSLNAMIKLTSMIGKQWKPKRHIIAAISATFLIATLLGSAFTAGAAASNGNPVPGVPHDTVMFHVQKSGPEECSGGKSAHIQANIDKNQIADGKFPPVQLLFTMIAWVHDDGIQDGVGDEPYQTKFLDCTTFDEPWNPNPEEGEDPWDDNNLPTLELQIGDKDHRKGYISTQQFHARTVGIPDQEIGVITSTGFYFSCVQTAGADTPDDPTDDVFDCTETSFLHLGDIQLESECVHKTKGKGNSDTGKVTFCPLTEYFLVDVDGDGNGSFTCEGDDVCGIHIFQIGCIDNPDTLEVEECPLGSVLWEFDSNSKRFTLQLFIAHDGSGKITKAGPDKVRKHQQ